MRDVTSPCERCGRTLGDLRADAGVSALRGAVPLCATEGCPLVARVLGFRSLDSVARARGNSTEFAGPSPPAVFVGRFGYPKVSVGPLLPPLPDADAAALARTADTRALAGLDIASILRLRAQLLGSKATMDVNRPTDATHALDAARELAKSDRALETEVATAKPPRLSFEPRVDGFALPMGPSVNVVRARLTENAPVARRVDAAVSDVHADAATAATEMYGGGVSVDQIQRLLSVGLLGVEKRRRLVPTRWSITATDDILGKQILERVRVHATLDAVEVRSASLFGNHFWVVFVPAMWQYEMIEAWKTQATGSASGWTFGRDAEGFRGRTDYASDITGAYYAARLAALEHLDARARQAATFVYREITEDYWAPLGVWVIREGVRHAMQAEPRVFESAEAAHAALAGESRWKEWPRHATLLRDVRRQRRIEDFC
ncbi:MAG: Nre family DNA repair protein [Thermoplasmatota archaeon]